jgi:heme oxygenase
MITHSSNFDTPDALPVITPATVGAIRKMMKEDGLEPRSNEEVSEYVEKLVARESFFRVVDKIQERAKEVDPQLIEAAVDEAVAEVKSQRRKQDSSADSR